MRLGTANPKSLLLGTALASTLIFSIVLAPTPAAAQTVTCPGTPLPGTDPIVDYSNANPLICNNTDDRTANAASLYRAIDLSTANDDNFVRLDNSGALTAIGANAYAFGIDVYTSGNRSSIDIENSNRINATSTGDDVGAIGIYASTRGDLSGIVVENDGIIQTRATALYDATATGIEARAFSAGVTINNRASISAIAQETENYFGATARGINADAYLNIAIDNRGDVTAQAISGTNTTAVGISADSFAGAVRIKNRGDVVATAVGTPSYAAGISADAGRDVAIENHGDITATATIGFGILAYAGGSIAITNSGALKATTNGIDAYSDACLCTPTEIVIVNSGDIEAGVDGIYAAAYGGSINVANAGAIQAGVYGIHAGGGSPYAYGPVAIVNSGQINAGEIGILGITGSNAFSSYAPYGQGGSLFIANAGPVTGSLAGIVATAAGNNAPVTVVNAGKVKANQIGIYAATGIETYVCGCGYGPPIFLPTGYGANSPVTIFNGQHRSRHRHQGGRSRCQQPDFDL